MFLIINELLYFLNYINLYLSDIYLNMRGYKSKNIFIIFY